MRVLRAAAKADGSPSRRTDPEAAAIGRPWQGRAAKHWVCASFLSFGLLLAIAIILRIDTAGWSLSGKAGMQRKAKEA